MGFQTNGSFFKKKRSKRANEEVKSMLMSVEIQLVYMIGNKGTYELHKCVTKDVSVLTRCSFNAFEFPVLEIKL